MKFLSPVKPGAISVVTYPRFALSPWVKNWPPQYPLFPGESNRYHFLFYLIIGLLEKSGIPLHWAVNLPSALGFFLLLVGIYVLARRFYVSRIVAVLALFLFLNNGSLSFLDYLKTHPLGTFTLADFVRNSAFPSFGPWNGSLIAAFWNLNIFTNQRHLGLSFAIVTLIIYHLYTRSRRGIYWIGFLLGVLVFLNQPSFAIAAVFTASFFVCYPRYRLPLLISAIGFLPFAVASRFLVNITPAIRIHYGYLTPDPVSFLSVVRFWIYNVGLPLILIPVGLILSPPKVRFFALPLLVLFLVPNVFQLSVDIINNHKFFNYILAIGSIFSAYALYRICLIRFVGPLLFILLLCISVLGGITDFFPVKNDVWYRVADVASSPDVAFFFSSTPPGSVVLNSFWFYHPASIAGRFIFNGYPYFTWSFGYDQVAREQLTAAIYGATDKSTACRLLRDHHISYVELSPAYEKFLKPDWQMWHDQFIPGYVNHASGLTVYSVQENCL